MFAGFPIRTETGEIVFTQNSSYVTMSASWAMPAEAAIIPRTILDLTFGIDVQEGALFFVAGVETRVEITFRHLRHVVFVEKLAAVAFLT